MSSATREKTLSNMLWRFLERCGAQGVGFIVSICLARALTPEAYGQIAIISVFTTILQVFVDSGLANSLIQKKDADEKDFSTVFIFNILMCTFLYIIMFFLAPFIARFYSDESLIAPIRVMSITLIISGFKNVQQAYIAKKLQFKKFFFATLIGTVAAAVVGITMAFSGMGVWALIAQSLINTAIDTIVLFFLIKWHPQRIFSFRRLKKLFGYGWKFLASSLLETVYVEARQLIIAKFYSSSNLAYYNKGNQFPHLLIKNVNASIDSVLFPTMSQFQDERQRLKAVTRRAIMTSTYIMSPLMIGLACCGESVIELLLTDKWLPALPFMRIFCITYLFYPIHTANLNAIKAIGRSDIFFKLEVIKKIVGVALLVTTMWFGVMAMAYSLLLSTVISMIINSWPNKKLLDYSFAEQIKDILPGLLLAGLMGISVLLVELLNLSSILTLIIQIPLGAAVYISLSALFKLEAFSYSWSTIKSFLGRIKKSKAKIN